MIGINLLREGLDIPECALVAIIDADKEGYLRSKTSLIQTIGRAARNVDSKVLMYADKITNSMKQAIEEELYEIVSILYTLKQEGLIREIGLSNETCWGTLKYLEAVKKFKGLCIASIQNEYTLMCRIFDNDFNELAVNENIPLLAYSPLRLLMYYYVSLFTSWLLSLLAS